MKLPIIVIIGRANVGKSTLFNRLIGKKQAIIAKEAGTTRDVVTGEVLWNDKPFILIDTAGLITDFYGFKEQEIEMKAQEKIDIALDEADIILFVMDAKRGITGEDKLIARKIRKYSEKVISVFNKADSQKEEKKAVELNELGFKDSFSLSAISGRRSGLLLDKITSGIPKTHIADADLKRIAIVGRPNVGKSTLFNIITNSKGSIVSDVPGTTRDAIKLKVKFPKRECEIELVDTAGFKKRGKIKVGIEKFSIIRAVESIYSSDVVLLVVDAKEGFTRVDAHLANLALINKKHLLIVVNKIDLLKKESIEEIPHFLRYGFILRNKIIGVSAKNRKNISVLISILEDLA